MGDITDTGTRYFQEFTAQAVCYQMCTLASLSLSFPKCGTTAMQMKALHGVMERMKHLSVCIVPGMSGLGAS